MITAHTVITFTGLVQLTLTILTSYHSAVLAVFWPGPGVVMPPASISGARTRPGPAAAWPG